MNKHYDPEDRTYDEADEPRRVSLPPPPELEMEPLPPSPRPIPKFKHARPSDYTWSPIDAASRARLAELDPDSRCAYEKLGYLPELRRCSLGEFRIDEHRTVSFEAIPEIGEVSYSEVSEFPPGMAQEPASEDDAAPAPLLRFLQVTDKSVPVPLMLSEFEDRADHPEIERALAGREIVDTLDDFGRQLVAAPPVAASSEPGHVWTCFTGGLHVFADTYCQNTGTSYCDNGAWLDLTRTSGNTKRYVSHSRIAACSNYGVHVEHQFRFWSWTYWTWKWTTVKYPLPPAAWWQTLGYGDVKWWKHVSNTKRRRKIRAWVSGDSGYLRAWTAFYN